MITSIVFVQVDTSRIPEVAESIAELDGVSEVYSVTGAWDLVAMVRLKHYEDLSDVIADQLSKVEGIQDTETMLAFRTYSSEDLGEGWALGFDG